MLKKLLPDEYVVSIFDIDLRGLRNKGVTALIIDIDNTLVSWGTRFADRRVLDWLFKVDALGFKMCLISNNTKRRVMNFIKPLDIPAVYRAAKPSKRAFSKAMKAVGGTQTGYAVIGDQLFTDVFGGKRLGLYTILVTPIAKEEFITTRLIRHVEKVVIKRMVKRGWLTMPDLRE